MTNGAARHRGPHTQTSFQTVRGGSGDKHHVHTLCRENATAALSPPERRAGELRPVLVALIEMKPPRQASCLEKVATNAAPCGGGQACTGQFAYSLLQTVGSESAVNGMGPMFLYQIIS